MLARTSLFAFSALVLVNTAACNLGAEPDAPSRLDPPATIDDGADQGASDEEMGVLTPTVPEEEPLPGMPSEPPGDTQTPEAPPARACDLAKPFGGLVALPVNTSGYETGGRLSADELTMYFSRKIGTSSMQPFVATRASKNDGWSTAKVLTSVDSTGDDGYLTTTKDELVGFFASSRSGNLQIHKTTRAARSDVWGGISMVSALGSTSAEDDPFLVANGSAIYFDSNRSGAWTIYRAAIDAQGKVGSPVEIAAGTNAVVTGDELTMYLSRADGTQSDIRVAKRAKATEAWGTPTIVTELSSASNDRVTWVSEDGCRVIVSSSRAGGAGSSDLYFATKPE